MPLKGNPLLANVTQNPLLIQAGAEDLFQSCIQHVVSHEHAAQMLNTVSMGSDDDDFWPTTDGDWRAYYRPYNVKDGTLQIPVMGVLLSRFPFQLGRWATGYKYIEMALKRGLADDNVKRIAFVEDSPGGEVTDCFELGDFIYESRGKKPMRAFAANHAYSAAYVIFSSVGDEGVVTRSGGVGSVGVVTAHVEYSEALEQAGIKVTFIFAGKHKVDGNRYEKLPESVKARIQQRIDKIYGVFTSTVARNRDMDEEAVKATEALTYDAQDAIDVGFADRIGSLEDEMAIFATEASTEDSEMATTNTTSAPAADAVDKATHDAAVASARAEGEKAGMAAQLTRIQGILGCDNAKDRPKAALSFALNTDMTVEASNKVLGDLPAESAQTPAAAAAEDGKGKPKAGATPFEQHMNSTDQPNVGADLSDKNEGAKDDNSLSASILGDYAGISGYGKKEKAA